MPPPRCRLQVTVHAPFLDLPAARTLRSTTSRRAAARPRVKASVKCRRGKWGGRGASATHQASVGSESTARVAPARVTRRKGPREAPLRLWPLARSPRPPPHWPRAPAPRRPLIPRRCTRSPARTLVASARRGQHCARWSSHLIVLAFNYRAIGHLSLSRDAEGTHRPSGAKKGSAARRAHLHLRRRCSTGCMPVCGLPHIVS